MILKVWKQGKFNVDVSLHLLVILSYAFLISFGRGGDTNASFLNIIDVAKLALAVQPAGNLVIAYGDRQSCNLD